MLRPRCKRGRASFAYGEARLWRRAGDVLRGLQHPSVLRSAFRCGVRRRRLLERRTALPRSRLAGVPAGRCHGSALHHGSQILAACHEQPFVAAPAGRGRADVAVYVEHGAEYARPSSAVAQVRRRREARRMAGVCVPPGRSARTIVASRPYGRTNDRSNLAGRRGCRFPSISRKTRASSI